LKRLELEAQRLNRESLDRFDAETRWCTYLIGQVQMETEDKLTTDNDNQVIEKNDELINQGATEAVTEQQELCTEVVNMDTVRLLVDRHWDQQLVVRRLRKLKKWTQESSCPVRS
jgi:hypothetical protein